MKKFYLLLSAAVCVSASASAVEKEMSAPRQLSVKMSDSKMVSSKEMKAQKAVPSEMLNLRKVATRADEPVVTTQFRPAPQVMSVGMTNQGMSVNGFFGFASSYGDVVFDNLSWGVMSNEWSFSEINGYEGQDWIVKTSDSENLVIKSGVGEFMPPILNTEYVSGGSGAYETNKDGFVCGASAPFWFGRGNEDTGELGLTFYQNFGLLSPKGENCTVNALCAYFPGKEGWNKNGVYNNPENPNNWEAYFSELAGSEVSNLQMESFLLIQPKPTSTYFFTTTWTWVYLNAKADTQLLSYVYPIDEEGNLDEMPIAIGYASVPKGDSNFLQFYYYPLDENGDELEGEVFVDSEVAISIEGFNGNDAITVLSPIVGFYPFDLDAYVDGDRALFRSPDLYMDFSMTVDGQTVSAMAYDGGGYYFDQRDPAPGVTPDLSVIAPLCYAQLYMDAVYPFIHSADGEYSVNVADAGGEVTVEIDALYYDVPGLIEEGYYELTAPEWIKVEFGTPSNETGITPMTLTVDATDSGRTGIVSIEGIGATFSYKVIQGDGAVNSISIDKNAEYFDLQGRRVANPEKGIYIKKAGNKAEKVLF